MEKLENNDDTLDLVQDFKCGVCRKFFDYEASLRSHILTHKNPEFEFSNPQRNDNDKLF